MIGGLRVELARRDVSRANEDAADHAGRSPLEPTATITAATRAEFRYEPYQFVPVTHLLRAPRRSLLLAADVGLGKTIEAGISPLELIARGVGKLQTRVTAVIRRRPGPLDECAGCGWEAEDSEAFFGRAPFAARRRFGDRDRARQLVRSGWFVTTSFAVYVPTAV